MNPAYRDCLRPVIIPILKYRDHGQDVPIMHTCDRGDLLHLSEKLNCNDVTPLKIVYPDESSDGPLFAKEKKNRNRSQADKFKQAARDLETNNDEEQFDENSRKLTKSGSSEKN